ncbi:MAG: ribose-phosphate pyrophosphokinase [Acidobacteria bacterium]|nr:ribose-phosphate pyrophosphokinase [Acidobacteriota bacterium]MCA1610608.1 ribose-phosphate pyrophosphokinase [Acidobacteriota bacterium]
MVPNFSYGDLKIFSGRAHPALAREICAYLQIPLGQLTLYNFSDGENYCQIDENVRGADVFIVQPTSSPVNDHVMELLILLDAFRRSSASRITAVMPYFGYSRQDKKDKPRVPIAAKLMADLLTASGADRILTMDLHAAQIQGFFDIPVDHLFAAPVLLDAIRKMELEDLVIVSPDVGGVARARAIGKRLGASLAIIDKRRTGKNETEVLNVVGDVEGKDVLILDDIIDTAGTMVQAEAALREQGARRTYAAAVHPVLSGPAIERIESSQLQSLLVTNTVSVEAALARCARIRPLSIAPILGEAIQRIHDGTSVSSLFV